MLDGPLRTAAAASLKLNLRSHSQGADAVARSLVDGSLHADLFIPITARPMRTVIQANKVEHARPFASTEMVLVYSPKSRFAAQFEAASKGTANWWEILQQPGLRFVRSNPAGDPGGRNIIFTIMLAASKYGQPDLVNKILGSTLNPAQILTAADTQAGLKSGDLDASGSYRIGPEWSGLPYITLPNDVNLSGTSLPPLTLQVEDKTFHPEPLVFYAGVLKDAANPSGARAFITWLCSGEGRRILKEHGFGSVDGASDLGS